MSKILTVIQNQMRHNDSLRCASPFSRFRVVNFSSERHTQHKKKTAWIPLVTTDLKMKMYQKDQSLSVGKTHKINHLNVPWN